MKKLVVVALGLILVLSGCSRGTSKFSFDYHDDSIPGSDYHYEVNINKKEVVMSNKHYSSTVDAKTIEVNKTIKVDDEEVLKYIQKAWDAGVKDSDWIYDYCAELENLEEVLSKKTIARKSDENWGDVYEECDLNADGIVTTLEEFKYSFNLMLNELEEGR